MPVNPAAEAARLSVAPMMDWTDRHCRALHRVLSRRTLLYTEMVTSAALVRGGATQLLDFDAAEHPVALQIGGCEPDELAEAARMGEGRGYDEVNLNVGCPSDRVQSGAFGAVLMKSPDLVVRCVEAMRGAVGVPVTVKCRIGVDDQDPDAVLPDFVRRMRDAGVTRIAIHARKALLQGLSPKENREVPPLDYGLVHRIKAEFPDLHVSINGGIGSLDEGLVHVARGLDGAMIGRAAYHAPWDILGRADSRVWGADDPCASAEDAVLAMRPYVERHLAEGGRLNAVTRHMLGLFSGRPGARSWRRILSEGAGREGADWRIVERALAEISRSSAAVAEARAAVA